MNKKLEPRQARQGTILGRGVVLKVLIASLALAVVGMVVAGIIV